MIAKIWVSANCVSIHNNFHCDFTFGSNENENVMEAQPEVKGQQLLLQ